MTQQVKKKKDYEEKIRKEESKECTFKPKTNESENKNVIKMLLKK